MISSAAEEGNVAEQPSESRIARLIVCPEIADSRGTLMFAERERLPFRVERIFALYGMAQGVGRGGHAHRAQHQLVLMLHGSCLAAANNGVARQEFVLERPNQALHVPPMVWLDLEQFTEGAACIVLASGLYDEADYIRDRQAFDRLAGQG